METLISELASPDTQGTDSTHASDALQSFQEESKISSPTKDENNQYSFEEDLWDSIDAIASNYKKGLQFLHGFSQFCKNYNKVLQSFSYGLQKCAEQFEKDMLQNKTFDTTSIAITNIKQAMEEISKTVHDKTGIVFGDLIEPIEQYQKHYQQTSSELISRSKTYWHTLDEDKKRLHSIKDKYYHLMHDVEQCEISIEIALLEHERGRLSLEQVQRITNQTLNVKYKAEIASQEYKKEVDKVNTQIDKFYSEYKPILQQLQQGEESRINFMKYNFEKFMKHQSLMGKFIHEKSSEVQHQIGMINSETDLKIFIDENRTYSHFIPKIDYQPYEPTQDIKQQKAELINQINQQKLQNNIQHIEEEMKNQVLEEKQLIDYLQTLLLGNDITFDAKSEIISSLHDQGIRDAVGELLRSINSPKIIENPDALKTLGEILKYLLTAYVHEKDENFKVIHSILHSSQQIFYVKSDGDGKEKQKVYLTAYLSDHGIWQEQQLWKVCIQKLINQKFHEAVAQMNNSKKNQDQQQTPTNGLFGQLGKIKGFWQGQLSKQEEQAQQNPANGGKLRIPKTLAQNIIFNSISKFLYHFVNFQLSFETSKEILLFFCNKYELDQTRTHLLLSELESIQKKSRFAITDKDIKEISSIKKSQREYKYGNGKYLILSKCLRFIGEDLTLRSILVLSKDSKAKLAPLVYKQALLLSEPQRLRSKRKAIWEIMLKINENQRDYYAFREKVMNNTQFIQNVEEVIIMDVQRSFTKTKQIDPVVLTNILKTYAFFNPEIEYCQGMNFVAGFLYLFFMDEVKAFKALQDIVEEHDMALLFNTDLPKLKLFFYQFDRLLNIMLPALHHHFKDEMVNASYYTSAWFITIFTQSLQNQEGDEISEKLLQLWDYFLTSGWKSIFKMGLFVLKQNETELQQMSFEAILNYITEKPKIMLSENISSDQQQPHLYLELKKCFQGNMHLNFILEKLEKEFKDSHEAAGQIQQQVQQQQLLQSSPSKRQQNSQGGVQTL